MIRLEDVTKLYTASKRPALDKVSINVEKGEFVFLIGPSGSGKSTVLRLLLREESPTKGLVEVDGKNITRMPKRRVPDLRRKIGCVFQDFRLLPKKNAYDNVAFALEVINKPARYIRRTVPEVLDLVGLEGKAQRIGRSPVAGKRQIEDDRTIARADGLDDRHRDGIRTTLRELEVVVVRALAIGKAFDLHSPVRILFEERRDLLDRAFGPRLELCLASVEQHIVEREYDAARGL